MHPRIRLALVTVAALAAAGVLVAALSARSGGGDAAAFRGAVSPPGIPAHDFTLRDQQGRSVSLAALRGQDVILTFMYTTCRDTCPILASQIGVALSRLAHPVPALAVSVDPRNDTPSSARKFLIEHQVLGDVRFLLGTRAQLAPVWRAYLVSPQTSRYDHTARVFLLDREGRQRVVYPVDQLTPDDLVHDVERMQAQGI
ncbi:MAG TPA: SCO family protein [Solirubrobacteraceae bacterium]|jgi:protein SCO1/2|nr:SCO family protein [Solirubrobacteraceae bacterium]